MLSLRHSIGNASPLESLVRNSKNVPHFRCYASPPPTESCSHGQVLLNPQGLCQQGPEIVGRSITKACKGTCLQSIKTILLAGWTLACSEPFPFLHVWQASLPITHCSHHPVPTAR